MRSKNSSLPHIEHTVAFKNCPKNMPAFIFVQNVKNTEPLIDPIIATKSEYIKKF